MSEQNMSSCRRAISVSLAIYKYTLSPVLHALAGPTGGCRFQPTCSEYAALAWQEHGLIRGSWLAGRRLLRCQPFGAGGLDPVPEKHASEERSGRHPCSQTKPNAENPNCGNPSGGDPNQRGHLA